MTSTVWLESNRAPAHQMAQIQRQSDVRVPAGARELVAVSSMNLSYADAL
jgi:hypothetical protein